MVLEFKKCCTCVPMRFGLAFWGYLKLLFDVVILFIRGFGIEMQPQIGLFSITTAFIVNNTVMVDFIMNIVFIIGCHRKKASLLFVYYVHSMVFLVITIFLCAYNFMTMATNIFYSEYNNPLVSLIAYFIYIGAHCYMIFILRSEITKLENNTESTTTEMTQPECTLKMIEDTEQQNEIE
ncbi:uncharacterized protein LOC142977106 [Anticarsia gemmatalis]|uniref:uncharacterized protein LOC142977106 n=1 Tax=Anticarsia gemmatalis TaxID=129554 RepID=UPI003F7604CF